MEHEIYCDIQTVPKLMCIFRVQRSLEVLGLFYSVVFCACSVGLLFIIFGVVAS